MLRRISADIMEKRELQHEVEKNASKIEEKQGEIERVSEQNRRQKDESENAKERIELAYSVQTQQMDELKMQNESMLHEISTKEDLLATTGADLASKEAELSTTRADLASKESALSTTRADLASKEATLEKKEATNQGLNDQLTRTRDYLTSKPQVWIMLQ